MPDEDRSLDVLGTKPLAQAVQAAAEGSVQGLSALLSRICLPAAEELGLLLKDKVSNWRAQNAAKIAAKAEVLLEEKPDIDVLSAHPKLVFKTIEEGSWTDDDVVLSLWAGLLASSCTISGKDESNLIFINILSQLTSSQARLLKYICETATPYQTSSGWIFAEDLIMEARDIATVIGVSDMHQIDRELDHLRHLGIIVSGFSPFSTEADVTPTPFGLQLYVRSQGYVGSPIAYFETIGPVEVKTNSEHENYNDYVEQDFSFYEDSEPRPSTQTQS